MAVKLTRQINTDSLHSPVICPVRWPLVRSSCWAIRTGRPNLFASAHSQFGRYAGEKHPIAPQVLVPSTPFLEAVLQTQSFAASGHCSGVQTPKTSTDPPLPIHLSPPARFAPSLQCPGSFKMHRGAGVHISILRALLCRGNAPCSTRYGQITPVPQQAGWPEKPE